jgi:uncharacterized membrane protein YsdA (DUF1294 family)
MENSPTKFITIIVGYYLAASCLAFVAIGRDKFAARTGRRRTPEGKLHLLSVAGGWPGTWLACYTFRHKTQKLPFQRRLVTMIVINCLLSASLLFAMIYEMREIA